MKHLRALTTLFLLAAFAWSQNACASPIVVRQGWQIQDSNQVTSTPQVVSQPGFATTGWLPTTLPATVMGTIVSQPSLGFDPFVAENLLRLPGSDATYYDYVNNFLLHDTPAASPFGRPWYYRTEFGHPPGQYVDLQLLGATYGAEIWINGRRVATAADTAGTYRQPKFDITSFLNDGTNALAIRVGVPSPGDEKHAGDLTADWVDWAPTPQDKNMGLWQDVVLNVHGAVAISHPQVVTQLSGTTAALTVETVVTNSSAQAVTGILHATLSDARSLNPRAGRSDIQQTVTLQPHETRVVQFLPSQFAALNVTNAQLWWPAQMGNPTLHTLKVSFELAGRPSDQASILYGIRTLTSELNAKGSRLFRINGKPILIRGGGWASDLYLRYSHDRAEKELHYVRDLGLNTIRLEGRFESDDFLQMTDRYGILVMPGWVCCSAWQDSAKWSPAQMAIAQASLRDQAYALRAHASVMAFLYGSDQAPIASVENMYLATLKDAHWPNPMLASAAATNSVIGKSGFKMNGPYDYVPPSYWSVDKDAWGGAWGFNTETSPGGAVPPIESLREFLPASHLWPIDAQWIFHAGERDFHNITLFVNGLNNRYGEAHSVEEFAMKSQVMGYDNHRAMFEAFNKNKYRPATGIIQWMLNNPWPSLIWHLYDYYLRPGGTYFGAKEANRPLHIQYSYDDQTIYIINQTPSAVSALRATVDVYDSHLQPLFSQALQASVVGDSSTKILDLPALNPSTKTYFVRLSLSDSHGAVVDNNFYWLSTQKEVYDWAASNYFTTPLKQEGDLRELNLLARTKVAVTSSFTTSGHGSVTLQNTGSALAFSVHAKALQNGHEILPVLWQDNYITLMPGESRTLDVSFGLANVSSREPITVELDGWNL